MNKKPGRKKLGHIKVIFSLQPESMELIAKEAERQGTSKSAVVQEDITEKGLNSSHRFSAEGF